MNKQGKLSQAQVKTYLTKCQYSPSLAFLIPFDTVFIIFFFYFNYAQGQSILSLKKLSSKMPNQQISQVQYEIYELKIFTNPSKIYFKLIYISIMELSVDQKIKLALDPVLERIAALEAENKSFKQELVAMQALTQPKTNHKPPPKQSFGYGQRPQTAKIHQKQPQHHEVKPDPKANHKVGQKKEELKVQNEQGKSQSKPTVSKPTNNSNKVIPPPGTQKDNNDPKNIKPKPTTATSIKPTIGANIKTATNDKKQTTHKNNQVQPQKKEQVKEEKKQASQQKQHKANSTYGVKSPVVNKPKPSQRQLDKKPIIAPSPAPGNKKQPPIFQKSEPKSLKGGKSMPVAQPQVKAQQVKPQIQTQAIVTDEAKVQQSQLLQSEVKEESKEASTKNEVIVQQAQKKQQLSNEASESANNEAKAEQVVPNEAKGQGSEQKKQTNIAEQEVF